MTQHHHEENRNEDHLLHELGRAEKLIAQLPVDAAKQQNLAAMGLLAAFVAHECRNRLTPIVGYARAASRSPGDRDLVQKAMTRIGESALELANLSELILDSISAASEGASVELAWHQACQQLSDMLKSSSITVSSEIESSLASAMSQVALSHVFENLLRNAIAAGTPGSKIALTGRSTRNGEAIRLEIQDSAHGMDQQAMQTACEPLVSQSGGTGLGLALCKYLVELAGGTISVWSRPGQGTTVKIELPAVNSGETSPIIPAEELIHPQD
jgi:signal transduction histidine kinase